VTGDLDRPYGAGFLGVLATQDFILGYSLFSLRENPELFSILTPGEPWALFHSHCGKSFPHLSQL